MKTVKILKHAPKKSRIIRDPQILDGKPIIAGTRIPVRLILDHLADGYKQKETMLEYPTLTRADIKAAMRFASRAIEKLKYESH